MIFRQLFDDDSSTFTYLLGDETSGLAVIVDPVIRNVDRYIKVLAELELRLHLSIDTHTHADHITAHSELRDTTGCRILVARQSRANCGCGTFDGSR
ncbi:MAG TPA: MBL fold metallo-hydrolase, partial [Gammaproteobacteria bacterium]|nr:MBL fold metallo-hydrolase [Gammaproteobacteria bacterium]